MDEKSKAVLGRMQRQCARREYCTYDVTVKIRKALGEEYGQEAVDEIVGALKSDGYVDDLRYASAFAREKSSLTGWGPAKIKFALRAKRMNSDLIEEALGEMDGEASREKLVRLVAAKRKTLQGDPQIKLKLIRYALQRGYDYSLVAEIVDQAI